jgi:hypothetical protein
MTVLAKALARRSVNWRSQVPVLPVARLGKVEIAEHRIDVERAVIASVP